MKLWIKIGNQKNIQNEFVIICGPLNMKSFRNEKVVKVMVNLLGIFAYSENKIFKTHLNYIKCLDKHLDNFSITLNAVTKEKLSHPKIVKFLKLSQFTQTSIDNEVSILATLPEYSQVVAPWIPVKCYYRLYYLESIFLFLATGSETGFSHGGHTGVRDNIQALVSIGSLEYNSPRINVVSPLGEALKYKTKSGSNLSPDYYKMDECVDSMLKKIGVYKEHDFKEKNKIKNYFKKKDKILRDNFFNKKSISPLDYFYWMRIKANYKDIDFLDFDNDISSTDAVEFVRHYVSASDKYASALNQAIESIEEKRGM